MNRDKPSIPVPVPVPVFKTPSGGGAMRFGRPASSSTNAGGNGEKGENAPTGIERGTKKRDVSAAELEKDPHSTSKRPYIPLGQPGSGSGLGMLTPRFASSSISGSMSSSMTQTPTQTPTQMQTPRTRTRLPPIPVPSSATAAYLTPSSSLNPNNSNSTNTTTPKPHPSARPKPLPTSSLERQIITLTTQNSTLQTKLREKEGVVRGLERDLRWGRRGRIQTEIETETKPISYKRSRICNTPTPLFSLRRLLNLHISDG
ncbi:hypothetical protein CPB83DRAFT_605720 [Crepidotus variabilis]|uniref:Uncharacterized protein n=1 Tax=Crepidotus variabilis TaxID=179855 RepID=A0A9P6E8L5_9AGAR|nr:hypothetical protein CPB83DRAFT_605720 [Crepidotus variabilis]